MLHGSSGDPQQTQLESRSVVAHDGGCAKRTGCKEMPGNFSGWQKFLYLDCGGGGYTTENTCQNPLNYTLKVGDIVCKIHHNRTVNKSSSKITCGFEMSRSHVRVGPDNLWPHLHWTTFFCCFSVQQFPFPDLGSTLKSSIENYRWSLKSFSNAILVTLNFGTLFHIQEVVHPWLKFLCCHRMMQGGFLVTWNTLSPS